MTSAGIAVILSNNFWAFKSTANKNSKEKNKNFCIKYLLVRQEIRLSNYAKNNDLVVKLVFIVNLLAKIIPFGIWIDQNYCVENLIEIEKRN